MALEITQAEWLKEMERLWNDKPQDEGFTVVEWAEKLNWSPARVRRMLKQGFAVGAILRGNRYSADNWDGRSRVVNVYRPKEVANGQS